MSDTTIDWHTLPLDELAGIINDDRRLIKQLDEQGTPSTLVRAKIAERKATYEERIRNAPKVE